MRWPEVLEAIATEAAGDSVLELIYGDAIRQAGSAEYAIPSLEHTLIADSEVEQWAPHTVQWDQFCATQAALIESERALMRLFNHDVPVEIGGLMMWSLFLEGAELSAPDRDGVHARAVRFRFTPIRERYTLDSLSS
jgi:hypothetical protein